MKPVALYKTWRGNEFAKESIESIYNHVDKIVFLHSEVSWNGEKINDVFDIVHKWKIVNDTENKIINISYDSQDQIEQYKFGIKFINEMLGRMNILFIDTDEIWESWQLKKLYQNIHDNPGYVAYGCKMHTYIKSPFYRIEPPEMCNPVVYFRGTPEQLKGIRAVDSIKKVFDDIYFHHFTYVRRNEDDLFKKIENIYKTEPIECVDLEEWKKQIWDKLPDAKYLHTAQGYQHSWKRIKIIGIDELPEVIHDNEIVKKFK